MADAKVKEVQEWLNNTFPTYFKYDEDNKNSGSFPVKPDGMTGNTTMKALVMAVQIHYGLTPVDGVWGKGTSSACPVINSNTTDSVILRIAQGGFYCKGYAPGGFDGIWGVGLAAVIGTFKNDLGIDPSGSMEPDVFKSLLTTDPTVLTADGSLAIRATQQYLNANYFNLFKSALGYIPTGGTYDRKTSKALIYAVQKVIGTTADGALGNNTFRKMPSISVGCTNTALVKLLQGAMACNGFSAGTDGIYDESLKKKITEFQKFMLLDLDDYVTLGSVNRRTWCALLWSKGDPERTPNACDCRTKILSQDVANGLYSKGFRYIGRYLTNVPGGYDKALTREEVNILLAAGLKIFPIFQESPNLTVLPSDFNKKVGKENAMKAISAAMALGLKKGTVLYFALDCDMNEDQIRLYGIPYFNGIYEVMDHSGYYNIGVYGARNTCKKVRDAHPDTKCFVSDMSTGYSGNLGFRMPEDFAFDQYFENKTFSIAGETFSLDYDMASGADSAVDSPNTASCVLANYRPPFHPDEPDSNKINPAATDISDLLEAIAWLEDQYRAWSGADSSADSCTMAVCDYLYHRVYDDLKWKLISPPDSAFIEYIDNNFGEHEKIKFLFNYIDDSNGEKRPLLVTDGRLGIFELPHLAIVIKCYMYSKKPGEWAAWAGDFTTAVKETYTMGQDTMVDTDDDGTGDTLHTGLFLWSALERIGAMEPDEISDENSRQFNYCDLIADLDGYAIRELLRGGSSLSESLKDYYDNSANLDKRYRYFKNLLGFEKWEPADIQLKLLEYFYADENRELVNNFAKKYDEDDNVGAVEAASIALSYNILYWAKYTHVV